MDTSDVIRARRRELGLSQAELANAAGISLRSYVRYESGDARLSFDNAIALAKALDVSLDRLAGQVAYELDLSGDWWAGWQTWKEGVPRIDSHTLEVVQQGELLRLHADRAIPVEHGSYQWVGELRLWDSEALIGWYRSTDAAVRSKGSMYLALHQHGTHAWGRWVGMSYDGIVSTGWGSLARTEQHVEQILRDLINGGRPRG